MHWRALLLGKGGVATGDVDRAGTSRALGLFFRVFMTRFSDALTAHTDEETQRNSKPKNGSSAVRLGRRSSSSTQVTAIASGFSGAAHPEETPPPASSGGTGQALYPLERGGNSARGPRQDLSRQARGPSPTRMTVPAASWSQPCSFMQSSAALESLRKTRNLHHIDGSSCSSSRGDRRPLTRPG